MTYRSAILLLTLGAVSAVTHAQTMWHPFTLDFSGPSASETDVAPNPFLDFRLQVTFTRADGSELTVPGFFDGDGSGGGEGNVWRVRIAPDQVGTWQYTASFRTGTNVAVDLNQTAGQPTGFDGQTGSFTVLPRDPSAPGFLRHGRLGYIGEHYLKFRDGDYWIKGGIDSPENFLGYDGFDNTVTNGFVHRYPTHVDDWQPGDPNFVSADTGYDGKAIIGALNYLASQNVNSVYFLPMNLGGDGQDTYPFVGRSGSNFDNTHYDISKLAQWDIVLSHAQRQGIALQFVLNETESANETWLDNGTLGVERKLFYRELAARFSYLLAKKWNLCEENDYPIPVLNQFADYLAAMDASDAPITVHTKGDNFSDYNVIVGDDRYSATSIQYNPDNAGEYVETWRSNSASAGRPWVLDMDENSPASTGLNAGNAVDLRKRVLWDVYLSGGHIEWYFGSNGQSEGGDQNTEDLRTREEMYEYMWYARRLLQDELPFATMQPADSLVSNENGAFGGAEVFAAAGTHYAVYLPNASGSPTIDLSDVAGEVRRRWFNPETGVFEGNETTIPASGVIPVGAPPSRPAEDWVVLFDTVISQVDSDGDGVIDAIDNCVAIVNPDQRDTDGDGFGNRCDADFNNDQIVNAIDLGIMKADFFATGDLDTDLNGDGVVNAIDLGILKTLFLQPPGYLQVYPGYYDRALRNPLKGFTADVDGSHEWATLAHKYFKWNELENDVTDGLDKILDVSNQKFGDARQHNIKVIPRVYLHWNADHEKYWPADMVTDDYDSAQFQARVVRLVERLGEAWNDDPRVAFVELGIFGKWGEHHSPDPTPEMQELVGAAFQAAFPDKLVSVRHVWEDFSGFGFGEYWDSWAHQQQMWGHGGGIAAVNASSQRYLDTYIGGEVAYNWGDGHIQPGDSPTDSVSDPAHRDFIENSIRWLHGTQLRWIANYDDGNPDARAGAEVLQRAMGYRFVLNQVDVVPSVHDGMLRFVAWVTNEGSAPFYHDWPVELALHDPDTRDVVWTATLTEVDIRDWLPGTNWTEPEWIPSSQWPGWVVAEGWSTATPGWTTPPASNRLEAELELTVPDGIYVLSIAVLDPASMQPSLRFATSNYWTGGRHPISRVGVGPYQGGTLPPDTTFDDPMADDTLHY